VKNRVTDRVRGRVRVRVRVKDCPSFSDYNGENGDYDAGRA
jgi:hypothetical protein